MKKLGGTAAQVALMLAALAVLIVGIWVKDDVPALDISSRLTSAALAAVPTTNAFPIQGRTVSSCANSFGAPRSGGRTHKGDDCFAPSGTPLVAVESGTIEESGDCGCLGGIRIWLRGDSGTWYYYAHNSVNHVGRGARVGRGQVIAAVGNTGNARTTPAHVHFEIHPGARGAAAIDPYPHLARWSRVGAPRLPTHLLWLQADALRSGRATRSFVYGRVGDIPLVGDWNGDGVDTPGIYRPGTRQFLLRNSNTSGSAEISYGFGRSGVGQWPIVGDWNGDGVDTVGVYEVPTAVFMLKNSHGAGPADVRFGYGRRGDQPLIGDWDGDGDDTVGVRRGGTWLLRNANSTGNADVRIAYGQAGNYAVIGDWNANRTDGIGVVQTNTWKLRNSLSSGTHQVSFTFGHTGDWFMPGDWNGDRIPSPGVVRGV